MPLLGGELLLAKDALADLYVSYARGQKAALEALRRTCDARPQVARALEAIAAQDERVAGASLAACLEDPLARAAEYAGSLLPAVLAGTPRAEDGYAGVGESAGGKGRGRSRRMRRSASCNSSAICTIFHLWNIPPLPPHAQAWPLTSSQPSLRTPRRRVGCHLPPLRPPPSQTRLLCSRSRQQRQQPCRQPSLPQPLPAAVPLPRRVRSRPRRSSQRR